MNQNIKAAADSYTEGWSENPYDAFIAGATYFQQSSGADEMAQALEALLRHNETKPIADTEDYYRGRRGENFASTELEIILYSIRAALAKYNSFIKTEEDGKANNYNIK